MCSEIAVNNSEATLCDVNNREKSLRPVKIANIRYAITRSTNLATTWTGSINEKKRHWHDIVSE